ncbi:hypothetical protein GCM10022226_21000 [Sphaerisporangium flaviroseum]|uniref:Alpha/beta hydrolase fold-5 domain-containing protein n=1 Tax=Sphaerisporangium flaviroseum TaxID=509199 RepID=A0ABP7HXF4_9ACTN
MRRTVGVVALVLVLAACGNQPGTTNAGPAPTPTTATTPPAPPSSPTPTRSPLKIPTGPNLSGCYTEEDGKIFSYGDDLPGVVMGKGEVGAVITYERGGRACTWRPLADRLVAGGYRVLLYARDLDAVPADNVVAMARRLDKERGVKRLFLIGGSIGGIASVDAAPRLEGMVAGVVNLAGAPNPADSAKLRVPLLQVTGENDGRIPAAIQQAHDAATGSPDRRTIVVPGESAHASFLFDTPHGQEVLDGIMAFVDRHKG